MDRYINEMDWIYKLDGQMYKLNGQIYKLNGQIYEINKTVKHPNIENISKVFTFQIT